MGQQDQLRLGLIGLGMIAERHIENFQELERSVVTWVADINEVVLARVANQYKIKNSTTHYQELLADPAVDAVVICTPPSTHCQIFLDTVQAQKHILLEKPMATDRQDMKKMLQAAAAHPELLICDCSCRHSRLQPKFKFVKEIIDSGELGEIYFIHHNFVRQQSRGGIEYHPQAKWFLNKSIAGGGPLLDWGVYDLSFHLGLLSDKPVLTHVRSLAVNHLDQIDHQAPVFDVEEHGVSFLEFDTGLRYYWERASNAHNEAPSETRIYGTKGGLKFSFLSWDSELVELFYVEDEGRGKATRRELRVDMSDHKGDVAALDQHFIEVVLDGVEPAMPLPLAAKHLDIIFQIYEAAGWAS